MTLGWKAAFTYPFSDPDWKGKLFIGGLLMLLCPPAGWTMALGYRRAVGIRLRAGMTPPLPEWSGLWWLHYKGGIGAVSVILGYYVPFMVLYASLAFEPSLDGARQALAILAFFGLIVVFPPLFLPVLPPLYSFLFPWVQLTAPETALLVFVFVGTAFVLPAAFVQVSVTGRYRTAFRASHVARFIAGHPVVYCEAWVLSLTASAIGVAMGPLAPWGLFWSYIVILHAFTAAFVRCGRAEVLAAFKASPLLAHVHTGPGRPGLHYARTTTSPERRVV
jgi:Protein of unknown function (DUF4013)